jgi:apolipoprotein N-acyltransferase
MALAFPKTNAIVLAPLGAVGLFWAWFGLPPKRAFLVSWAAGSVFFAINFAWFGETAGALIAPFGFFMTLGPGIGAALFEFALPAAAIALLRERAHPALVPAAAAAAFTFGEWLRAEGIGVLGTPFGSLGYTQVDSPLAPLAAFVGTYGITFFLLLAAAYAAFAIRSGFSRRALAPVGIAYAAIVGVVALAWLLWPARTLAPATIKVAAIQGNIAQSIKFKPEMFYAALDRYTALTLDAARGRPALIVWPETVMPAEINRLPWLQKRFADLAKSVHAEIVIGGFDRSDGGFYNALYFYRPEGVLDEVYRKRQLVPFAEHTPFENLLGWIPWTKNASHISMGTSSGVVEAGGIRVGPIVCWESAFSGLATGDVHDGADAFLIATDDAWFGVSAGPYQHSQIAQMRALETGRWIVRAASTGISGIIAPNGRYVRQSNLNETVVVAGTIGQPVRTVYDSVGPGGIALGMALVFGGIYGWGRRRVRH